ncbi:BatE protein [Polaribacter pacificus]|uniref:BatE protein n=1 Tax=Polaribacter pacificus TaxID=1775173 RepID=A0A917MCJ7_9FLAO|nr:SH3 domain-containing protein [Polaribacter pacificus]GGG91859.1 BatE protein [Polaribacter pacificus]
MKKSIYIVFILVAQTMFAQTSSALFDQANGLYKEGQYKKAIELYTQIEGKDSISSDLYYNLGNCYYKLNSVANTIYYYEKALLINPLNTDATNNLTFAKRMVIDNIEELPQTFLQRLETNYIKKLSFDQWARISVIFSVLTAVLFLLFYISKISNKKRIYFITSIIAFLGLLASLSVSYHQYDKHKTTKTAIIFAAKVSVKNAPTSNSDEIFELHEGTKVQILDAVDDWNKILLADGKIGWMSSSELKLLTQN